MENPQETAERVGLAALIIQVCYGFFLRGLFVWCAAKPKVMMYFHFRTSKVYSYLTISSVGIVSSRVVGTLESSYSIPTPASIGEKRLQGSLALLP